MRFYNCFGSVEFSFPLPSAIANFPRKYSYTCPIIPSLSWACLLRWFRQWVDESLESIQAQTRIVIVWQGSSYELLLFSIKCNAVSIVEAICTRLILLLDYKIPTGFLSPVKHIVLWIKASIFQIFSFASAMSLARCFQFVTCNFKHTRPKTTCCISRITHLSTY